MRNILPQDKEIENHTSKFLRRYRIGKLMKGSNFKKEKGFSSVHYGQRDAEGFLRIYGTEDEPYEDIQHGEKKMWTSKDTGFSNR